MLILTMLALLMAATMGWLALRLLREEQRRSEARVAALSAALDAPRSAFDDRAWSGSSFHAPERVQRRPEPADAPTLPPFVSIDASDADEYFADAPLVRDQQTHDAATARDRSDHPSEIGEDGRQPANSSQDTRGGLFGDGVEAPAGDDRRWLVVAGVTVIGLLLASALWLTSRPNDTAPRVASGPAATATAGIPLDLISLGHEQSDKTLVIRGLVRNPAAGSTRTATAASVFLFDEAGSFLGSGRSPLDAPTLAPGADAAFEVQLPANPKVRRYRVTFRGGDGAVVPHLDRRPTDVR